MSEVFLRFKVIFVRFFGFYLIFVQFFVFFCRNFERSSGSYDPSDTNFFPRQMRARLPNNLFIVNFFFI